ncbi:MAG: endonuclease III, partial [Candidatus Aenigmatarchaeota archaeon]
CILSLRTRDETTRSAGQRLFAVADTPKSISQLSAARIAKLIYPVGFYKTKAKRIKQISKEIWKNYCSKVPEDFEKLLEFKGVGRKTANIVFAYGFNRLAMPIDTHCHRIPNRLGWIKTKTPEQTEMELRRIVPKRHWREFNNNFVKFGQNVCKPVRPRCDACPVTRYCDYYRNVYLTRK